MLLHFHNLIWIPKSYLVPICLSADMVTLGENGMVEMEENYTVLNWILKPQSTLFKDDPIVKLILLNLLVVTVWFMVPMEVAVANLLCQQDPIVNYHICQAKAKKEQILLLYIMNVKITKVELMREPALNQEFTGFPTKIWI